MACRSIFKVSKENASRAEKRYRNNPFAERLTSHMGRFRRATKTGGRRASRRKAAKKLELSDRRQ